METFVQTKHFEWHYRHCLFKYFMLFIVFYLETDVMSIIGDC